MTVDHSIACQGNRGTFARGLAGLMVAIFPVGVPFALFTQLFLNRDLIMKRATRSGDKELEYIGECESRRGSIKFRSI